MANGFILGVFELDLTPIGERNVQLPIRLGRSSLNDVPVAHRLVSEFHARIEEVDGRFPKDVRIFEARVDPGSRTGLHAHGGEEHHVVLSGHLRATQGDHVVELGPGDYLLWDATIPHDVEVVGDEPVRLLLISHTQHGS